MRNQFSEGDFAEQAGNLIGHNCLNAIICATSQGERMCLLVAALIDLKRLPNTKRAAGGFAVALVSVIEIGLRNLPKVEGADHV